jgi:galacturan 1,4-alpha-galacturonidase
MFISKFILSLLSVGAVSATVGSALSESGQPGKTCTVKAGGSEAIDDAPAVIEAFKNCGEGGRVVFLNTTYYINSVMNTSSLRNCEVDLYGTLLVYCSILVPSHLPTIAY